jgi:hypothetical protein
VTVRAALPYRGVPARLRTAAAGLALLLFAMPATAQPRTPLRVVGADVQGQAEALLGLLQFTLTPDLTTSSLSINNASSGNPSFAVTQLGGGGTLRNRSRLYAEGNVALSRFDPVYFVTDGAEQLPVSVRWSSATATGGLGYNVGLAEDLSLRPIAVLSLGRVSSDLKLPAPFAAAQASGEVDFLQGGSLNTYGLGASLMLDYERYRTDSEFDFELRYNAVRLNTLNASDEGIEASYLSRSLNAWARYRAPTGLSVLDRPLRYVLETAATNYFGNYGEQLGFDWLLSLGVGLELDASKYNVIVDRTRLMLRYVTSDNVEGISVGVAVSF